MLQNFSDICNERNCVVRWNRLKDIVKGMFLMRIFVELCVVDVSFMFEKVIIFLFGFGVYNLIRKKIIG